MVEVEHPGKIDSCYGQIVGELIVGNYNSFHPFILLKTDFVKNFEFWQIKSDEIHMFATTFEGAFKFIDHWLTNVCSPDPAFNWAKNKTHKMDENLYAPIKYFNENFKVPNAKEFHERIREQLEVIREADSDLTPLEQYLNEEEFFLSIFN